MEIPKKTFFGVDRCRKSRIGVIVQLTLSFLQMVEKSPDIPRNLIEEAHSSRYLFIFKIDTSMLYVFQYTHCVVCELLRCGLKGAVLN